MTSALVTLGLVEGCEIEFVVDWELQLAKVASMLANATCLKSLDNICSFWGDIDILTRNTVRFHELFRIAVLQAINLS